MWLSGTFVSDAQNLSSGRQHGLHEPPGVQTLGIEDRRHDERLAPNRRQAPASRALRGDHGRRETWGSAVTTRTAFEPPNGDATLLGKER